MRLQDWAFFLALWASVETILGLAAASPARVLGWGAVAAVAAGAARHWSRTRPGPMPHLLRWILLVPRGAHSPESLKRLLEPRPGERLLEIGPGIGVHALPVAAAVAPGGTVDALDVQRAMLDDLERRAARAGIANVATSEGDASSLPYPDASFDGAYLMTVLGEIPDQDAALRELRRVLKPSGRLVVGELLLDPDFVSLGELRRRCERAGFTFDARRGPRLAYLARFRPPAEMPGALG